ncbi:Wzz/FepE/Etk N-terminal domain-containing protein [Pseudomonadota bacterium]|jgi:LPS O-antigen subunit length determinant protein (WzzB/FepE family)|nr:Wzz/FepE/Etk N-terminal domain-containing protein [Pseudomonadota bacterium]
MNNTNPKEYIEDDIDLAVLIRALWQGKWIIIGFTSVASILVVIYSLSLPNIYSGQALLVPVSSKDSVSGSTQSLGGLASLAGISLSDSSDKTVVATEKLQSLSFFEGQILTQINIPDLMAVESWNPSDNSITYDHEVYDDKTKLWTREVAFPQTPKPSAQESFQAFMEHLSVVKDLKTNIFTITISHQSPFVAKQWADLVVTEINTFYREKDRSEAEFAVNYLNDQIAQTRLSEVKMVIAEVLAQQIQKLTLIEANDNYIFDYIDPPAVMEKKSAPRRAIICIIGALLGGFIGALVALFSYFQLARLED